MTEPVLRWPGSKWRLSDWIISYMPSHDVYVEPFLGSGAVFFNKYPTRTETINDLDGNVINLFKVIRDNPIQLVAMVEMTPWSRQEYNEIRDNLHTGDSIEDARRFLVRCWQGFGGKTAHNTSWSHGRVANVRKTELWNKLPSRILSVTDRLKNAQIECVDAIDLIQDYNDANTLIYSDSPYLATSRRNNGLYNIEMGKEEQHIKLLEVMKRHKGPAIISGYPSELYDRELVGWQKQTAKIQVERGLSATEVIWLNPKASIHSRGLF